MSELIPPPSTWKFRLRLTAADLSAQLGSHRILSVKTLLDGGTRLYSAVTVKDFGLGGSWDGHITVADLKSTLGQKFRLTALDCFEERRKTICAAAWVDNPGNAVTWDWGVDLTASALDQLLKKQDGKLISIRAYKTTLGGQLDAPAIRYAAIWRQDDGVEWGWIPDAIEDSIFDTLDAEFARLVSIDNLDATTWLGDAERFCAVWYKNAAGQVWFWNFGLSKAALPSEPPKFCSWPLDVADCAADQFVSLLEQYPKPADPALASLLAMSGAGAANLRADLWQEIQWSLNEQNLTADNVDMESAFMFAAAEGGWCWWSGNFTDPAAQTVLGLPLSLAASQGYTSSPWWQVSNNPRIALFPIKAVTSGGKRQYLAPADPDYAFRLSDAGTASHYLADIPRHTGTGRSCEAHQRQVLGHRGRADRQRHWKETRCHARLGQAQGSKQRHRAQGELHHQSVRGSRPAWATAQSSGDRSGDGQRRAPAEVLRRLRGKAHLHRGQAEGSRARQVPDAAISTAMAMSAF